MKPETIAAVERLPTLTVNQLRDEYVRTFGEPTASRHKTWLVRRIAWKMQANDEGGLSERALARAAELARGADIRLTAPRCPKIEAPERTRTRALPGFAGAVLAPGTVLRRDWQGRPITVTVLSNGFECQGTIYRSLSAVATTITGTRWNGHVFFGLKKQVRHEKPAQGAA